MNTQMGSSLPIEKLHRSNYSSWEYKMNQYLVGQGYWSYINGVMKKTVPRRKLCIAQDNLPLHVGAHFIV